MDQIWGEVQHWPDSHSGWYRKLGHVNRWILREEDALDGRLRFFSNGEGGIRFRLCLRLRRKSRGAFGVEPTRRGLRPRVCSNPTTVIESLGAKGIVWSVWSLLQ